MGRLTAEASDALGQAGTAPRLLDAIANRSSAADPAGPYRARLRLSPFGGGAPRGG